MTEVRPAGGKGSAIKDTGQERLALLRQLARNGGSMRVAKLQQLPSGRTTADQGALQAAVRAGFILRYGDDFTITALGRAHIRRAMTQPELPKSGRRTLEIADVAAPDATTARVLVNIDACPLLRLGRHRSGNDKPLLSETQLRAGERLQKELAFAQAVPRITSSWGAARAKVDGGPPGMSRSGDMRDEVIAARQRVDQALAAVGPDLASVLWDLCGEQIGLERIEKKRGWPKRSAKLMVQVALSALARYYGIGRQPAARQGRIRHWGSEDYRPLIVDESEHGAAQTGQ